MGSAESVVLPDYDADKLFLSSIVQVTVITPVLESLLSVTDAMLASADMLGFTVYS